MKIGTRGAPWVTYEGLKSPPVRDPDQHWVRPPVQLSDRCRWWLRQVCLGWQPNRSWRSQSLDGMTRLYGVYRWELEQVLLPAIDAHAPVGQTA